MAGACRHIGVKYWELIASRLSAEGFSWGYTSFFDSNGRKMFSVDASCTNGKRHVIHSDEILSAFLELERLLR
jgi:hypothetical protein